jgi:prepilin-type N-terminal cleavage/methylation domain-containing protein
MKMYKIEKSRGMKEQDGFTLVEILVAIVILSLGLLAIETMLSSAMRVNRQAREITEACTAASDHIERLMSLPLTHAYLDPDNNWQNTTTSEGYRIEWIVRDDAPSTGSVHIRVIVKWTEAGVERTVPMDYVRTKLL